MAKRRKLSELISEETQQSELPESKTINSQAPEVSDSGSLKVTELQNPRVTESQSYRVTESQSSKVTDLRTDKLTNSGSSQAKDLQTNEETDLQTDEIPKYLTLIRKEARLHEEQLDKLTSLTRSLNRKRKGTGERITENTLIRVAVDLLLNRSDELQGSTEQEIKKSVGL